MMLGSGSPHRADYVRLATKVRWKNSPVGCSGSTLGRCLRASVLLVLVSSLVLLYTVRVRQRDPGSSVDSCWKTMQQPPVPRYVQRGRFWVLANLVVAEQRAWNCLSGVTLATQGDVSFVDGHLEDLCLRWQGPVSMSVFAPGQDFEAALQAISHLRKCSTCVRRHLSFHLFFPRNHLPDSLHQEDDSQVDCGLPPPWLRNNGSTYRSSHNLTYPINVARNVARHHVDTRFVLTSDVELLPSMRLAPLFLDMLRRHNATQQLNKVFVLPVFEVTSQSLVPENKQQLVAMLRNGSAVPFHQRMCPKCHDFPRSKQWMADVAQPIDRLDVFHVAKRHKPFQHWEPIFIGTDEDPVYDERLCWEGKSDKMTQAYIMCVLDYEFHILDNAFLVHRPGIKVYRYMKEREHIAQRQGKLLEKIIYPELKILFGESPDCYGK